MRGEPDRRELLQRAAAFGFSGLAGNSSLAAAEAAGALKFGKPEPFSFERLKLLAKKLAGAPYQGANFPAPGILAKIDYEAWGKINFNMNYALFADGPNRFPVSFFHLGMYFRKAVQMNLVEGNLSREILYEQAMFDMPEDSIAKTLPKGVGFAGFRVQEARDGALDWRKNDWAAFLGAAYFRAIGELYQYGLSARAIALDVAAAGKPEEFPDFTRFFFEAKEPDDGIILYALLEGPSIAGAAKFRMRRGKGVIMDIEQSLYMRAPVSRFGLCPLTSMYWFSETKKSTAVDWRPEVHDSDGLAVWTGTGERFWRPLNNPQRVMTSSFSDDNPRGFGLLQRDRNFDHYQDGVNYDRRPSLWVEPRGSWGTGAVELIEIPTDDEIHDNIVAMWVPGAPVEAGDEISLDYRLYWQADEPFPTELARCVATRLGNGGQPGKPRPKGVRKFMVEFQGKPLEGLPFGVKPEAVLWASRGSFSYVFTEAVPDNVPGHWRAQFDFTAPETNPEQEPVEMRLFLRSGEQILSETWLYQYQPF